MVSRNNIKDVLSLALPAVGEMILYMLIWVFDTMMVGQYGGKITVTAVGLSCEIIYTFVNIFISVGLAVGTASIVARKVGAKKYEKAEEYASISTIVTVIISLIISAGFFFFSREILIFANAESNVLDIGILYMKICSVGIFFNMITTTLNSILRAYGNTKTPLVASIIINIINISLDWILIFGRYKFPELGVKGAALATMIANIIGFIFISYFIIKYSKIKPRIKYISKFSLVNFSKLLKLSIPASLQEAAFSICRLINTLMIMVLGNIAFSANQITTTIESLSFMPGWGFAVAATTLVGQKVGEKNYEKAREYANTCVILGLCVMGACALIFLLFPDYLMRLFINETEKEVIKIGASCIMIASVEQIPLGISMIYGGALKGYGDTRSPFIASLISSWMIRLPLMYYFIYIHHFSVIYVWWITAVQWIFDGAMIYYVFRRSISKRIDKEVQSTI